MARRILRTLFQQPVLMLAILLIAVLAFSLQAAEAAPVKITCYQDKDKDGYGITAQSKEFGGNKCSKDYVTKSGDCNDKNNKINPGATETCDNIDNDCDAQTDENVKLTFYRDADSDTYGSPTTTTLACTKPSGYVTNSLDCNDANANTNPAASEVCDGSDNNCAAGTDENNVCSTPTDCGTYGNACLIDANGAETCTASVCGVTCNTGYALDGGVCNLLNIYYKDTDGDTYGDSAITTQATSLPFGYVTNNLDCSDTDANIHPNTIDICGDSIDQDCSGADLACPLFKFYYDADTDGYGNPALLTQATSQPIGYASNNLDCNDNDINVNPTAGEICNSVDDNCNGAVNEGLICILSTYYQDTDADSYGNPQSTTTAFFKPSGYVTNEQDCNDANAAVNICATGTVCSSGACQTLNTYYYDADRDTYGDVDTIITDISQPAGYTTNGLDCNDANALINPTATETCNGIDDNCANSADEGNVCNSLSSCGTYNNACATDINGAASCTGGVCSLTCNTGYVLENSACKLLNTYYKDSDADGYGSTQTTSATTQPTGYVTNSLDCNDGNALINPAVAEVCDDLDNNCDIQIDEGMPTKTYYKDLDGDGYGDLSTAFEACGVAFAITGAAVAPAGYVELAGDCNDNDAATNPGAAETCDNIDNDCDAQTDENVKLTFYSDADGDGQGTSASTVQACTQSTGYVASSLDCDDANSAINTFATEVCNSVDDDCNGKIDEGLPTTTYYKDVDADGYGGTLSQVYCAQPLGYNAYVGGDCNDYNVGIKPGATEVCGNNIDEDCSGADLACPIAYITYYLDSDSDGYGGTQTIQATSLPAGYATTNGDCNDANADVGPGKTEICDGADNNCDGLADNNLAFATYYYDADFDSYGVADGTKYACSAPASYAALSGDCNNYDGTINPGATEVCDGTDNNCDNQIDENKTSAYYYDSDRDGYGTSTSSTQACSQPSIYYSSTGGDCNDNSNAIHPGATEVCGDSADNNCDGRTDEGCILSTWYKDSDTDGYGGTTIFSGYSQPEGYITTTGDCNDANAAIKPGATEVCGNSIDEDCSGADLACTITNATTTTTSTTCTDTDGYDIYKKGTCTDSTGTRADRCVARKSLEEWQCDSNACIGLALVTPAVPSTGECVDGAWDTQANSVPATTCADTDGFGYVWDVKGTCTDSLGLHTDYCSGGRLIEHRCETLDDFYYNYNNPDSTGLMCASFNYGSITGSCVAGAWTSCTLTNNGVEICGNGIDEDCSGADLACTITNATTTTTATTCTDSDGANNFDVKGTCIDSKGSFTDYCSGGSQPVIDFYCSNGACNVATSASNCIDGAISTTTTTSTFCIDSDSSSSTTKGTCTDSFGTYTDFCDPDETIRDYYCGGSGRLKCVAGGMKLLGQDPCTDGAVTTLCSDSGSTCTDVGGTHTDYCHRDGYMFTYSCSLDNLYCVGGMPSAPAIPCTYTAPPSSCTDSDKDASGVSYNDDSIDGAYFIKGTCTDTTGNYTDYCQSSTIVRDYSCVYDMCATGGLNLPSGSCDDGAWVLPEATCTDTDGGQNFKLKGACTDNYNITHTDYCSSASKVVEYYCATATSTACSTNSYVSSVGSCVDGAWSDTTIAVCTPTNGGVEICGNGIDEDCSGADLACTTTGTPRIYSYIDAPTSNQQINSGSTTTFGGWAGDINGVYPTSTVVYINDAAVSLNKIARADACKDWPKMVECTAAGGNTQLVGWWFYWTAPSTAGTYTIKAVATAGSTTSTTSKTFSVTSTCTPTTEICGNGIDEDCSGSDLACTITNATTTTTASCQDTDNGKDYYATGTCTDAYGSSTDECITSSSSISLKENFCSTSTSCSFTLYSQTGYDCYNGKLVQQTPITGCTDSDGDKLYTTKGTCTDSTGSYTDSCPYSAWVKEYYCTSSGCSSVDNTVLDYVCTDGALVKTTTTCTQVNYGIEVCGNGIDEDCNGSDLACPIETATTTTETAPLATTCTDADSDGYGATSTDLSACTGSTTSADCNDADASIRPGATEICGDGIDQDCDGSDLACLPSGENATITGAATTVGIMLLARLLFAGLFGVQFISGPF